MNYSELSTNNSERCFYFAIGDLATLIEQKETDVLSILRVLSSSLRQCDQRQREDIETAMSVLLARKAEDAYFYEKRI
jgi:hypothetical protein